ncbi:MAG TPA: YtxH domain-containing protein [Anaeromyxobacter sp.]|nr:YtxH domain-containing protein [Anaeromyxobacter sp.]
MDWTDWGKNWRTARKYLDREEMLKRIGLEQRSPAGDVFTGLGLFAVGVLVGAGLGLMFAPKRGDEMRQLVGEAWKNRGRQPAEFERHMGVESGLPPTPTGSH